MVLLMHSAPHFNHNHAPLFIPQGNESVGRPLLERALVIQETRSTL